MVQNPEVWKLYLANSSRKLTYLCKMVSIVPRTDAAGFLLPFICLWPLFLLLSVVNMFVLSDARRMKSWEPIISIQHQERRGSWGLLLFFCFCRSPLSLVGSKEQDRQIKQIYLQLFPHQIPLIVWLQINNSKDKSFNCPKTFRTLGNLFYSQSTCNAGGKHPCDITELAR